jgi:hypothetical protein
LRDSVTAIIGLGSLAELHALAHQAVRAIPGLVSAEFFTSTGLGILVEHAGLVPPLAAPAQAYLLLETSGPAALDDLAGVISDRDAAVGTSAAERRRLWALRERQPEAAGFLGAPIKLDVSVPAAQWVRLASGAAGVVAEADPGARVITFGHVADGNVHVNIVPAAAPDGRHENAVFSFVASLGGSISAEHGIGALKAPWLELARTPAERALFARIRAAFDPSGTLNPHILPRLHPWEGLAADRAGRGGSVKHRLGHEVVGDHPRLPGLGIEVITEHRRERVEERRADSRVVGGADPVADVAGAEGLGVGEQLIKARYGLHKLGELAGEPDLLLSRVRGEQRAQCRVPPEQLGVEPGRQVRQPRSHPLVRRLYQGDLLRRHDSLPRAWARPARLLTPSLA